MRRPGLFVLAASALLAAALLIWLVRPSEALFKGVRGPDAPSSEPLRRPVAIADFDKGLNHRLAVLVTDPQSGWLGLVRGLRARGVPFTLTTDVERALRHKVVLVYPMISGRALRPGDFPALARHVHAGGYLLAFDVEGGGLAPLFGVAGPPRPEAANRLVWSGRSKAAAQDRETAISRAGGEAKIDALAYAPREGEALARYETGAAGLVCRRSVGRACVLGVDVGALSGRAMNGRGEPIARSYVNGYEPSLDTLYRWITDFYVEGEPMPWLISTAPAGRDFSVVLSHDIDFTEAIRSARVSAQALRAAGADATFFIQTKYVRDYNDDAFFRPSAAADVKAILGAGMEVGSHSVAHARTFKAFPYGDGHEGYPSYRPFVESRTAARGGTILGELRVSKFLLERLSGAAVASFRAGYLSDPFRLPDGLAATGYRYDSSITANASLTHLPFQLTYGRGDDALAPVYEFPVTLEDEAPPLLSRRLDAANAVLGAIAAEHGLAVVLTHPDAAGSKLRFEEALLARWRDRAWFASMRAFGDWWAARDALQTDVDGGPGAWTLTLRGAGARRLRILLPKMRKILRSSLPSARGVPGEIDIDALRGPETLIVR